MAERLTKSTENTPCSNIGAQKKKDASLRYILLIYLQYMLKPVYQAFLAFSTTALNASG